MGVFQQNLLHYSDALKLQLDLTKKGVNGWLVFSCHPVITVGRRGKLSDILISQTELKKQKISLLNVDRGGQVTYHGPEQLLGFPLGTLQDHVSDSRGVKRFMLKLTKHLGFFIGQIFLEDEPKPTLLQSCNGIWVLEDTATKQVVTCELTHQNIRKKITSFGLSFHRNGISHGFALNINPVEEKFKLIHACGEPYAPVTSIFKKPCSQEQFLNIQKKLEVWLVTQFDPKP